MPRVLFLSKGSDSASTRYRAIDYFTALQERGIEALHVDLSGSPRNYLAALSEARRADVVIVLRKTFGGLFRTVLRHSAKRLVFDFDDAIFCNSDGSPSRTRMQRFQAMMAACDHVLAGNNFLASAAARFNPAVTRVPTSVDAARYCVDAKKPCDTLDLVWIGSSSTRKYLEAALPALENAARQVPKLRLKIIADFTLQSQTLPILDVRWDAQTEAREIASAHIGIAPMVDNDWTRGKCGLKVLQYMAAGLPVISSRAGVNAEIVRHGENGLLVDSADDWARSIAALANDEALRNRLGQSGQELVRREYTLEVAVERLLQAVASSGRAQPPIG